MGSLDSRNRHCLYRLYHHDHEEERCYKHDQQQYHQLAYFSSPSSLIHRKALGNIFLGHNHPSNNNNNERNNNDNNKSNNKYNNKTTKATSSSSRGAQMMIIRLTEFLFNTTIICLIFTYIHIKSRKILILYSITFTVCFINVYQKIGRLICLGHDRIKILDTVNLINLNDVGTHLSHIDRSTVVGVSSLNNTG